MSAACTVCLGRTTATDPKCPGCGGGGESDKDKDKDKVAANE